MKPPVPPSEQKTVKLPAVKSSQRKAAYPVATVVTAIAVLLDEVFGLKLSTHAVGALAIVGDVARAAFARHVMRD